MHTKEKNLKEFAFRLNQVLDQVGFAPKGSGRQMEVAKKFKVSQIAARNWLEGNTFPKHEHLISICKEFNVDMTWLLVGTAKISSNQDLNKKIQKLNKLEKRLQDVKKRINEIEKLIDES